MLARKIADAGLCEFRRQLEYNAKLNGAELVIASRWSPSGKMCSVCGRIVEDLPLSAREWTCQCAAVHDLEINTAKICCYALARVSCTPKERLWRGRLWRWSYSQRETSLVEAGISLVLNGAWIEQRIISDLPADSGGCVRPGATNHAGGCPDGGSAVRAKGAEKPSRPGHPCDDIGAPRGHGTHSSESGSEKAACGPGKASGQILLPRSS